MLVFLYQGGRGAEDEKRKQAGNSRSAAQKYPDKVVLWMKPNHFASEAARKEWLAEKADFDRKVAEAEAAKKKAAQRSQNN
jgi:hypothetical protein